jgi:hypothetical protein
MEKNKITLTWKGVTYNLVFNLNVMEEIQEEYGSISDWGDLTDNEKEPNAKAVIFGLMCMINEGIDIDNEDNQGLEGYVPKRMLSRKQVGRLLTDVGMEEATQRLNDTVVNSVKSDEKN